MHTFFDVLQTFCRLCADFFFWRFAHALHTLNNVNSTFVHTLCRLSFFLIPAVQTLMSLHAYQFCALQTFCKPVQTLSRVNVFHCYGANCGPADCLVMISAIFLHVLMYTILMMHFCTHSCRNLTLTVTCFTVSCWVQAINTRLPWNFYSHSPSE